MVIIMGLNGVEYRARQQQHPNLATDEWNPQRSDVGYTLVILLLLRAIIIYCSSIGSQR